MYKIHYLIKIMRDLITQILYEKYIKKAHQWRAFLIKSGWNI